MPAIDFNQVLRIGTATAKDSTGFSERMRITSDGLVGIGTSSPARPLDVNGSIRFASGGVIEAGGAGGLNTYIAGIEGGSGYWAFATNGSEKMRIASNGIVTMNAYGAGAATFSAAGVISSVSD